MQELEVKIQPHPLSSLGKVDLRGLGKPNRYVDLERSGAAHYVLAPFFVYFVQVEVPDPFSISGTPEVHPILVTKTIHIGG